MINTISFSIVYAVLVWILGVCSYLISFYIPVLENQDLQANIVLALALIPSTCLGTYLFYKKSYLKPAVLALIFIIVITILDACITVPVFLIPNGGSYSEFFGDPKFYVIALELYLVVLYFGNYLTHKAKA
ncbi:MAG: hypothetical protein ACON5F_14150 [Jejuia sp.]